MTRNTANVFADLGFPDAVERRAKLRLAYALNQLLVRRRLSPAATSRLVRVTQAQVSAIRRYKLTGISVERLMTFLTALGQDVHVVSRASRGHGSLPHRRSDRLEVVLDIHSYGR